MSTEEQRTSSWLDDRLGLSAITSALAAHRAPRRNFVFYLGGITLFLLAVEVASGILLVLYYQPDVTLAYGSVERIATAIPYGNLVRNTHIWAGDLFVASLFAHLFTIVARRSFRPPHELSWLSGIVLLLLGVGLAFTGAVLPWSQTAYTNARVGSELGGHVPFIGAWVRGFLRGGDEVGAGTLGHAYGFHVAALPAAVTALVLGHLFFLSRKPATIGGASTSRAETMPLYPDFIVRQAVALTGLLVAVMTLAIFVDRPLGIAADPRMASPLGAHPPWYFLPIHQLVRIAPKELLGIDGAKFLVGAACIFGLLAVALPFIDRRGSKVTAWIAWGLLFVLLLLGISALD